MGVIEELGRKIMREARKRAVVREAYARVSECVGTGLCLQAHYADMREVILAERAGDTGPKKALSTLGLFLAGRCEERLEAAGMLGPRPECGGDGPFGYGAVTNGPGKLGAS